VCLIDFGGFGFSGFEFLFFGWLVLDILMLIVVVSDLSFGGIWFCCDSDN